MVTHGYHKRACAVVLVKHVKNPSKLVREMLIRDEDTGETGAVQSFNVLGGEVVEKLAHKWGLEMVDESYFWTKMRWDEHMRGREGPKDHDDHNLDGASHEYLPQGTAGCVALDQYGTLCVVTSTGGLTNKLPYRIGG